MPRDVPNCPSAPRPKPARDHRFTIKLITPMFGGGVEPGVADPYFPIRPTTIRGQLQFWWRAAVGARFESVEKLRDAQSEVWGSTKKSSPTRVLVDCGEAKPATLPANPNLAYVLFPFRDKGIATCIPRGFSFELNIQCSDEHWSEHVEPAVWAWVNFGGLGARTRRGCGALWCKELSPGNADELAVAIKRFASSDHGTRQWPTLAASLLTKAKSGDPIDVWDWLIGFYKHFRQGEGFGRNSGNARNRPGRSRYPEPEAIRRVTNRRSREHGRMPDIPDDAFPRAEFGLPIIFHFKDRGEPPKTTLNPSKDRDRMASPLILKPLALKDGNAIPLILRLKAEPVDGVELFEGKRSLLKTEETRGARLANYANSPLKGSPNGSALEAFLNFASREGFKEVFS